MYYSNWAPIFAYHRWWLGSLSGRGRVRFCERDGMGGEMNMMVTNSSSHTQLKICDAVSNFSFFTEENDEISFLL